MTIDNVQFQRCEALYGSGRATQHEFSETVGYVVQGPQRSLLWLPDIDKWERWDTALEQVVAQVDLAFVDATFFDESELPGRAMADIRGQVVGL